MQRALSLSLFFVVLGAASCARGAPDEPGPAAAASPVGMAPWSRQSAPQASAVGEETAPLAEANIDLGALEDLLAAAPKKRPETTGPDGTSLVGTASTAKRDEGGEAKSKVKHEAEAAPGSVTIGVGDAFLEPGISSPAIERAARADLYWNLVHRCRDDDGKILPPDAVTLQFTIDAEGTIATSTILATSLDARYERAAQCMRRELSAVSFRAPTGAGEMASRITMTVPSAD